MKNKKLSITHIITIFFIIIIYTKTYMATDGETIYVGGDVAGTYNTIDEAIKNANKGDTIFVYNGTYFEKIKFYKALNLIGEDKESTIIQYNESDETVSIAVDGCTFNGFTVRNSIGGTYSGINIESDNNIISNNIIENNLGWGIYMYYSTHNIITNNIFKNDGVNIVGNLKSWNTHTIENNTINDKPLLFYKNMSNTVISSLDIGQIILANCTNFIIKNNNISNVDQAIVCGYSSNCSISKNNISNNIFGIRLNYASNNSISDNHIEKNDYGIYIIHSNNNEIIKNNIYSNKKFGCYLCCSSMFNRLYLNNFTSNNISAYDIIGNQWYKNKTGNYWDDYNGSDNDGDGIGDKPYYDILSSKEINDPYPIGSFKKNSNVDEIYGFEFFLFIFTVFIVLLFRKKYRSLF